MLWRVKLNDPVEGISRTVFLNSDYAYVTNKGDLVFYNTSTAPFKIKEVQTYKKNEWSAYYQEHSDTRK